MGLFDLPSKEMKFSGDPWFQKLNAIKPKYRHDNGYYIIYRAGHDLRYIAWFFGIAVFSLVCLHRYWGVLPSLSDYPAQKDLLGLYLHYINLSGPILFLGLTYYAYWLKKIITFGNYNILQYSPKKTFEEYTVLEIIVFFLIGILGGLLITIRPSMIASVFYLDFFIGAFSPFFDSPFFVLFVCLLIVHVHTTLAQFFLMFGVIFAYFIYQNKKQRE